MSDPFATIFGEEAPVVPRQAFAEQLRTRITVELGELMTETTADAQDDSQAANQGTAAADELVSPGSLFYFTLPGADIDRSARFYSELFGWELHQGDAGYHVANVYPPMGLESKDSIEPQVWIEVAEIDAAVEKVRALGGQAEDAVHYDSGWSAACRDPQGVQFNLTVPRDSYRQPARRSTEQGELFYWTLPAPDAVESKAFYAELLGWQFGDPGNAGGMHVENRLPDGGLGGGREGVSPELFFRVGDLELAMARVRELGGTAEPAGEGDEGSHAMCVDDQGVSFGISQPAEGY
ncbi:MAG: VOC family protein [Acidimicrobiales bacterium]